MVLSGQWVSTIKNLIKNVGLVLSGQWASIMKI